MQITSNNINFNGAFRFKQSEAKAQKEVPELITKGKQLFHNILEKGDQIIITRDNFDKRIGAYIINNNINNFEYYPEINTFSGLTDDQPQPLIDLLKDKATKLITDIIPMQEAIANQKKHSKKLNENKELKKITDTLRLNIENPQIKTTEASTVVRDNEKKRTIEFIGINKGTTYVFVKPDSLNEESIKCIIDNKGNLQKKFESPNEIHKFFKIFSQLKKEKRNVFGKQ